MYVRVRVRWGPAAAVEGKLGKNMNNQHIAHTSAASGEGAGGSRGLYPAGWQRGAVLGPLEKDAGGGGKRGSLRRSTCYLSPSTKSRSRKKKKGPERVPLNFFCVKALSCSPLCCLRSGTSVGVFVPYLSTEMSLVTSHPHFIQL